MRIVASKYFIGTVYSFDAPTQSPLWHAVTAFSTQAVRSAFARSKEVASGV